MLVRKRHEVITIQSIFTLPQVNYVPPVTTLHVTYHILTLTKLSTDLTVLSKLVPYGGASVTVVKLTPAEMKIIL